MDAHEFQKPLNLLGWILIHSGAFLQFLQLSYGEVVAQTKTNICLNHYLLGQILQFSLVSFVLLVWIRSKRLTLKIDP